MPPRPALLPHDAITDEWCRLLEAEKISFARTDFRMLLPPQFLLLSGSGEPAHWLAVSAAPDGAIVARTELLCRATGIDGYVAIGAPGLSDLVTVYAAAVRPSIDRRRYAQILLNRGNAQ
ncbi:hypothetical protein [Paraburkholderia fungorum]|uniref:hypothetical protein n=1 Tax=Paraburkholderia fungorum TaxID=134537 RepID=UPI0038B92A1C